MTRTARHQLHRPSAPGPSPRPRSARERGSEAIEAAIGVPAFLLFVALIIAAGRIAIAHSAVDNAAADAARSASLARTQPAAKKAALNAAAASLSNQKLQCQHRDVIIDTSGFTVPVGTPSSVTVTIECRVGLSDVAIPGLPGSRLISATMTSPLDTYRERRP